MTEPKRFTDLSGASRARPRTTSPTVLPHTQQIDTTIQRALINRLSRIEGHVRSVKTMVEKNRKADEVLLQIAAIKAALNNFSVALLKNEIEQSLEAPEQSEERIDRTIKILGTLLKQS